MSQPLMSSMNQAGPSSSANADPRAFLGIVETTVQALRLAYAARQGVIPRIVRRLNRKERKEWIASGAVFVFDVKESGIQRWTDWPSVDAIAHRRGALFGKSGNLNRHFWSS